MSERPTGEIALDLRKFIEWYGCDPGVPMSAVDVANEAADGLVELDAAVKRLDGYLTRCDAAREEVIAQRDALLAALPTCPRCGGTTVVHRKEPRLFDESIPLPCPDCIDGKVPIERLVKVFEAVFSDEPLTIYPKSSGLSGVIDATLAVLRRAE